MKPLFSGPLFVALLAVMLPSCQSVPERPLQLESSLAALGERAIAPEPVAEYARALATARGEAPSALDESDGLTLREAEAVALWYNADLRIARLEGRLRGRAGRHGRPLG